MSYSIFLFRFKKISLFKLFKRSKCTMIVQIGNLRNFPNWKFLEFAKLEIFGIFQIGNFWNLPNWKFLEFF